MDYTKLKGCHPGGDSVGLKGTDGIYTLSSYQAGRDDMITIIKSEIERRYNKHKYSTAITEMVYAEEDEQILSFLSTLETEKPIEGLEEEIKRYYDDWDGDCRYAQTARHFAKWGAEHLNK